MHDLRLITDVFHKFACPIHGGSIDQQRIQIRHICHARRVDQGLYMRRAVVSGHNISLRERYAQCRRRFRGRVASLGFEEMCCSCIHSDYSQCCTGIFTT